MTPTIHNIRKSIVTGASRTPSGGVSQMLIGGGVSSRKNAADANFAALYAVPYDRSQTFRGLSFCILNQRHIHA